MEPLYYLGVALSTIAGAGIYHLIKDQGAYESLKQFGAKPHHKAIYQLKQLLTDEQGKLNALVGSLSDGIIMLDSHWQLLVINPAARRFLNLPLDNRRLTTVDIFAVLGGHTDFRALIEQAIAQNHIATLPDIEIKSHNLKISALPVKDQHQHILLGAVLIIQDIGEQKSLQALRGQFEVMVVHELRSPLTNIRSVSDRLLRDLSATSVDQLRSSLQTIQQQSAEMLDLVNDLLDIAKVETGKFTIQKQPTDLNQLIQEVVDRYQVAAKEKNIQLKYISPPPLDKGESGEDSPLTVPLDGFRIRQVLNNLINNAIKFTASGQVIVMVKQKNSQVEIGVQDTGIGIAEDQLSKIFNKFAQLHQPVRQSGTGLGLVIAKGIVEAHGGQIGVDSKEGEGSRFWFTIPT